MLDAKEQINPSFRVFPEGDVIAIWGEPNRLGMVSSYQHLGQHGDASLALMDNLRVATENEAADLRAELERIGYELVAPQVMDDVAYVACGGSKCPHCHGERISADTATFNDGQAFQDVSCHDCNEVWVDVYALTGWREFQ